MIRRRLGRALDWRFRAVNERVERVDRRLQQATEELRVVGEVVVGEVAQEMRATRRALDALAPQVGRSVDDIAAVRALLDGELRADIRAILDRETENRRQLFELRSGPAYEKAFTTPDPLISITMATRDREPLLIGRSLPSLLAQTHTNIEVIVIGDAAVPAVGEAVAALGDSRVRYDNLTQRIQLDPDPERHRLVASTMARNEAQRRARGLWILHFDDDDHLRADALASLLALAREQRAEVAYGGFEVKTPAGSERRASAFPPQPGKFGFQGALMHAGLGFLERELFAAARGLPGDMYLLERMLRIGVRFAMLEGAVWDYYPSTRWNAASASTTMSQTSSTSESSSSE
jgi:hypothetical protein